MSTDPDHPRPAPLLCPICKAPVQEADRFKPDTSFPFCSPRCKLIDLGRWLGGKYQIPVEHNEADVGSDEQ